MTDSSCSVDLNAASAKADLEYDEEWSTNLIKGIAGKKVLQTNEGPVSPSEILDRLQKRNSVPPPPRLQHVPRHVIETPYTIPEDLKGELLTKAWIFQKTSTFNQTPTMRHLANDSTKEEIHPQQEFEPIIAEYRSKDFTSKVLYDDRKWSGMNDDTWCSMIVSYNGPENEYYKEYRKEFAQKISCKKLTEKEHLALVESLLKEQDKKAKEGRDVRNVINRKSSLLQELDDMAWLPPGQHERPIFVQGGPCFREWKRELDALTESISNC